MYLPTPEQNRKMHLTDNEIRLIISRLDRKNMESIPSLILRSSCACKCIGHITKEALKKEMITEYESFQLYEVYDRLGAENSECRDWPHSIVSFNLAMMAKLFGEETMYKAFCKDTEYRYTGMMKKLRAQCGGKLPNPRKGDEFYYELTDFLPADKEHLEYLRDLRSRFKGNARINGKDCFFNFYPWHLFRYEDELLMAAESGIKYHVRRSLSPLVCDIISAAEIRTFELKKGYYDHQ